MNLFRKNYDILLGIFDPDGWLEISYPLHYYDLVLHWRQNVLVEVLDLA